MTQEELARMDSYLVMCRGEYVVDCRMLRQPVDLGYIGTNSTNWSPTLGSLPVDRNCA